MNTTTAKNILLILNDEEEEERLIYEMCFQRIRRGDYVLLLGQKAPQFLTLVGKQHGQSKESLQRFIVMLYPTLQGIVNKLLVLHDWTVIPQLVILDLRPFLQTAMLLFGVEQTKFEGQNNSRLQSVCRCIATLFNFMDSVRARMRKPHGAMSTSVPCSLLLLPTSTDTLSPARLELLINLYYYKDDIFKGTREIQQCLMDV